MFGKIKIEGEIVVDLSKNIHIGIIKAQKDYINWSGLGVGHSAEYLLVTNIAQSISTLKYVDDIEAIYVEKSTEELAELDELENYDFRNGRCDICVEDKEEYSIIEVKNTVTNKGKRYDSIISDIDRIKIFLENNNSIKDCYICFLNANYIKDREDTEINRQDIQDKIFNRFNNFREDIKSKYKKLKFTFTNKEFIEITDENLIWGWQSVVTKIQLNK